MSFTCSAFSSARLGAALVLLPRSTKIALMLGADLVLLPACSMIALLLRVGDIPLAAQYGLTAHGLTALATIPAFAMTGLYGAVIRFIDQRLLISTGIGLAMVVGLAVLVSAVFGYRGVPHSALAIYWFIAFSYVVISRRLARAFLRSRHAGRLSMEIPAAIYGAGEAGVKLALAMRASVGYRPVCFFDDESALNNRNVAGLKVYHADRIGDTVSRLQIGLIVIAIPSATPEQRRDMMYKAAKAGVPVKILCSLIKLADEAISTHAIREIKIDDLLGREPIRPQQDLFAKCVRGRNVLVTGAGGSIGSELCRQIMTQGPRRLHLLDHAEHALYAIEHELTERFPALPVEAHLGSVCDARLVERVIAEGRIDTVYHAAAYKHVPLVEGNMAEGLRNNILGAEVLASAALKFHVAACVLVSSDKAVRPTSVMGASKRIAELIFQAAAIRSTRSNAGTVFCSVRFGNVLGSSGSVVPLFKRQIERGGPITITHPEVVRYFMSVSEAAQLVMQAGAMATGGDVFVMDMGEQVKIVELARTMVAMCGFSEKNRDNPDGDIEIRYVGLRPGEKLYEELFAGDDAIPSRHPRIMTTTEYLVDPDLLARHIAYLMVACGTNDKAMIRQLLHRLVKGYAPGPSEDAIVQLHEAEDSPPGVLAPSMQRGPAPIGARPA
jgi:FlaA1/EpsC-like NDP-sugar epimerase